MAKITLDLNRFKASGIYTIEFDASERVVVSTQTIRLVVGFSKIGPFNAPVFLRDIRQARRIFGTIDSKLEARGSFFHRAIETCLSVAPVFALNLLPLNNAPLSEGGDGVEYRSFALASDEQNGNTTRALYSSFYNKERFWFPDVEYLQATVDSKVANAGRLFNVVNLGQQAVSIIIKKSVNANQYNIPADEYYDADEIPEYIYAKDFMSDYFIDLYIVKGDWTNHSLLSQDPLYSKYFDLRGIKSDKLNAFLSADGITVLGSFTGCIIPNFLDNNGSNQSIDTIVNANYAITGIFLNINENELSDYANSTYKVDMIGNNLINTTDDTIDFLSYNTPIKNILKFSNSEAAYTGGLETELTTKTFTAPGASYAGVYTSSYPYGGKSGLFGNVLNIPKPQPSDTTFTVAQWEALSDSLTRNSLIRTTGTSTIINSAKPNDYVKVESVLNTGTELKLQLTSPLHEDTNYNALGGVPEGDYIITTSAFAVPSAADTIVVNNFAAGDVITAIGTPTQSAAYGQPIATIVTPTQTSWGQPLATITSWTGGTGAVAAVATYTGKAIVGGTPGVTALVSITTNVSGTITAITVTTAGTKYKAGDSLTIAANWDNATAAAITITGKTFTPVTYTGVASTATGDGTGATFNVNYDAAGATNVSLNAAGTKYEVGDTVTILGTALGGATTANDMTFAVATLVPTTYTVNNATGGGGTGAIFVASYNAAGALSVSIQNGGSGYTAAQTVTIPLASVGGAPAANITFTITTVQGANINPGDIMLIQAPGFAKYYEVLSSTVGSQTTIVVKNTGLSTAAPFFIDKWCVAGFAADEFAAYSQPSDIKVTLFDVNEPAAAYLWPDTSVNAVADTFGYIINPGVGLTSVDGLGQTATVGTENKVTLYNNTTSAAIAGNWYILDENVTTTGVNLTKGNVDFGKVRIVAATGNTNPFSGATVGNVILVTLPSGQQFTGTILANAGTVTGGVYNLNSASTGGILQYAQIEVFPGAKLAKSIKDSLVVDGDRIKYSSGSSAYNYLNVDNHWSTVNSVYSKVAYGLDGARIRQFSNNTLLTPATANFATFDVTYVDGSVYNDAALNTGYLAIYSSLAKNIQEDIAIEGTLYDGGKKFKLSAANANKIEVGDFLKNNDLNNPKLIRVISKVKKLNPTTGAAEYEYTMLAIPGTSVASGVSYVTRFIPIQKFVDRYQFTLLSGFKMTDFHLPGTPAQLEKILSVLELTNVGETLKSRDVISFRYIVDTFLGGLEPHMGPKQVLSRLAMNRQKCLALLNAPSCAQFQNSTDPRFTDLPDPAAGNPKPVLNTEYISTGGNLSLGPSYTWGLPDEENGAKFIGVFTPNIVIREDGKNKSIPPAADVSNNFIRKFINGEPYGIIAGPRRGVISNPKFVGLEYDFLLKDREYLEPMGLNPIVVVRNVGPMIFANQTAYQRTLSAFNNLHVRDLLITVEEAVIEILQNYLFEFNDAATRLQIKSLVDSYLDVVRTAGGIYDYSTIMDDSNNTPEIIDQNFGILDIGIEPARGLQKFISRITVLKTGAISSGGFAAV